MNLYTSAKHRLVESMPVCKKTLVFDTGTLSSPVDMAICENLVQSLPGQLKIGKSKPALLSHFK